MHIEAFKTFSLLLTGLLVGEAKHGIALGLTI
jgi:hypothetical protein